MQSTSHILLVRPNSFKYNPETATSNAFQHRVEGDEALVLKRVQGEFDAFAEGLRSKGIHVVVMDDTPSPEKPDAIFPNNWATFHSDGKVILYPMFAANRRTERRRDIIEALKKEFIVKEVIDLSGYEAENRFLEGTGSMVFDHMNKVGYACLSDRTDQGLFEQVCGMISYQPISFRAVDNGGKEIYHTNVMMCIGIGFCVICLESIADPIERKKVEDSLRLKAHEIVDISRNQMNHFVGNMLCVRTQSAQSVLVCSKQAASSLTLDQKQRLAAFVELVPLPLDTIEMLGGGSARCMMAEVFLPQK
jgi:hypothetical protein